MDTTKIKFSVLLVIFGLLFFSHAYSKPYIPGANDILIKLKDNSYLKTIKKEQKKLDNDRDNFTLLDKVLTRYLNIGRKNSDPRYFGYAEALIQPYLKDENTNESILIHWADILQHRHAFKEAIGVLNNIVSKKTENSKPYLMRAISYQGLGQYQKALESCTSLILRSSNLLTITCVANVKSYMGELLGSYELLVSEIDKTLHSDNEEMRWALTVAGDMAQRLGYERQSTIYYEKALRLKDDDYYLLASYSDLLLYQKKYEKVTELLGRYMFVDNLFVRLLYAEKALGKVSSVGHKESILTRYNASEYAYDNVHLRDQAYLFYRVEDKPEKALDIASRNWAVQKEIADTRLLLELSIVNKQYELAEKVIEWVKLNEMQDIRINNLVKIYRDHQS